MCGIVGYVGDNKSVEVLLGGLRRLEYRGYDSAGVAVIDADGTLDTRKKAGKLAGPRRRPRRVARSPTARTGIGHTRWATHGGPTDRNAHPHLGDDGKLALIHNGIIENFSELKAELLAEGVVFTSDTDSEVAALLVGRAYRETGDLTEALRSVVARLHGAFTLLVIHADQPGVVVGARRNSPLVIGLGDGENFLGSDVAAFVEFTQPRDGDRPGPDRHDPPRQRRASPTSTATPSRPRSSRSTGTPPPPRRAAGRASWPRRSARSPRRSRRRCSAACVDGAVDAARARRRSATTCSAASTASSIIALRHRRLRRRCSASTRSRSGRASRSTSSSRTSSATATRCSTERTLVVSISQSGETMDTLMAVKYAARARAPACSRSATPRARRSRASPTPCSTRTPAPRSPSHRRRPSSRR